MWQNKASEWFAINNVGIYASPAIEHGKHTESTIMNRKAHSLKCHGTPSPRKRMWADLLLLSCVCGLIADTVPLSVEQLGREEEESDEENDEDGKGKGRGGGSFKKFKKVLLRLVSEVLSYQCFVCFGSIDPWSTF